MTKQSPNYADIEEKTKGHKIQCLIKLTMQMSL